MRKWWPWLVLPIVAIALAMRPWERESHVSERAIGLVVPEHLGAKLLLDVWIRAAAEQGVPLRLVSDAELLRDWYAGRNRYEALIVPDTLHSFISPSLENGLRHYTRGGGHLFLTFDAGTRSSEGQFLTSGARLAALAGVQYGADAGRADRSIANAPVFTHASGERALGLPPGKTEALGTVSGGMDRRLVTYSYGALQYPHFVTRGAYDGEVLLRAADGSLVAGVRKEGRGDVLFVNLPLGQLKANTDGWLLHRFLRYFARRTSMPALAMTPGAMGGLVMNVHVDSGLALPPLRNLLKNGLFDSGSASIHVTAGPDVNREGDGEGFNVDGNPEARDLLRRFEAMGHRVGSHGGWIHNVWSAQAGPQTAAKHTVLLERNYASLARVLGHAIDEFSAPAGNHPAWVTDWLRTRGIKAYYTTANSGSAPTRTFRDGRFEDDGIWSFPIASLWGVAAFEEARAANMNEATEVGPWLEANVRFAADQDEVRLIYFHPPGTLVYPQAFRDWVESAKTLQRQGRFRWYTMSEMARFLDRREGVQWRTLRGDGEDRLEATQTHAQTQASSLQGMSWVLPTSRYQRPKVLLGRARIGRRHDEWVVVAEECRNLLIALEHTPSNLSKVQSKEIPR